MQSFLTKHRSVVSGVLSGFDRLLLRGTLRAVSYANGLLAYLCHHRILLRDFSDHAQALSRRVVEGSLTAARQQEREILYLPSSRVRKEELARRIAAERGIDAGLICVLKTVEPCQSFAVQGDRQSQRLTLQRRTRKCLHLYHYLIHPRFGFLHVRLQTWYPFTLQVCLNGREWLARQLDEAGLAYRREANCISWVADVAAAQRLLDAQRVTPWEQWLSELISLVHPAAAELFLWQDERTERRPLEYYWSSPQSEWATDVMFHDRAALRERYERCVRHGITAYGAGDVLRFLGRRVRTDGTPWGNFAGEVSSDVRRREEGLRIKHRLNGNSLKMYDKGSVLRVETTLQQLDDFRVFRRPEGQPQAAPRWMPLRKGVVDLPRRAEICQAANERLLESQAAVEDTQPLQALIEPLTRPVQRRSRSTQSPPPEPRRYRALNPLAAEDARWLAAVSRPEFCQNGFRNRDLRALLYPEKAVDPTQDRRRSGIVTRRLALLRAHRLIRKVPHTHRYQVTSRGRQTITAILAAQHADTQQLAQLAA